MGLPDDLTEPYRQVCEIYRFYIRTLISGTIAYFAILGACLNFALPKNSIVLTEVNKALFVFLIFLSWIATSAGVLWLQRMKALEEYTKSLQVTYRDVWYPDFQLVRRLIRLVALTCYFIIGVIFYYVWYLPQFPLSEQTKDVIGYGYITIFGALLVALRVKHFRLLLYNIIVYAILFSLLSKKWVICIPFGILAAIAYLVWYDARHSKKVSAFLRRFAKRRDEVNSA